MRRKLRVKIGIGGEDIYGRKSRSSSCSSTISKPVFPLFDCSFVTLFWPKKVKASKLEEIHAKMVMKESAPRQQADNNAQKKPRLSVGVKTNGSSSAPNTASVRTNGKSYR